MSHRTIVQERGVTLIEALVAIAILAFAMMSVFAIYTHSSVEIRRAQNRTRATQSAQTMMEMIRSSPYHISYYNGLTTRSNPPNNNPVGHDILTWRSLLEDFPGEAAGTISVEQGSEVIVEVQYDNYGLDTTATLCLQILTTSDEHSPGGGAEEHNPTGGEESGGSSLP